MSVEGEIAQAGAAGKPTGNRSRKPLFYGLIALVILLGMPITCVYLGLRGEDMREPDSAEERAEWIAQMRKLTGIAELPPSATDVRIGRQKAFASLTFLLRFRADPADIEAFLASSPVLEGSKPVVYSTGYVLYNPACELDELPDAGGDILSAGHDWPSWFDPWLSKSGRMFRRGPDVPSYELLWIIVNDDTHVVYAYEVSGA